MFVCDNPECSHRSDSFRSEPILDSLQVEGEPTAEERARRVIPSFTLAVKLSCQKCGGPIHPEWQDVKVTFNGQDILTPETAGIQEPIIIPPASNNSE